MLILQNKDYDFQKTGDTQIWHLSLLRTMIIKTRMVKCDRVTEDSAKTSSATKPCLSYSPTFISTIASGRPSAVAFNRMVPALPVFCMTAIAFP